MKKSNEAMHLETDVPSLKLHTSPDQIAPEAKGPAVTIASLMKLETKEIFQQLAKTSNREVLAMFNSQSGAAEKQWLHDQIRQAKDFATGSQ